MKFACHKRSSDDHLEEHIEALAAGGQLTFYYDEVKLENPEENRRTNGIDFVKVVENISGNYRSEVFDEEHIQRAVEEWVTKSTLVTVQDDQIVLENYHNDYTECGAFARLILLRA